MSRDMVISVLLLAMLSGAGLPHTSASLIAPSSTLSDLSAASQQIHDVTATSQHLHDVTAAASQHLDDVATASQHLGDLGDSENKGSTLYPWMEAEILNKLLDDRQALRLGSRSDTGVVSPAGAVVGGEEGGNESGSDVALMGRKLDTLRDVHIVGISPSFAAALRHTYQRAVTRLMSAMRSPAGVRTKRQVTDVEAEIGGVEREGNSSTVTVDFYVRQDGQVVPVQTALDKLQALTTEEMAALLDIPILSAVQVVTRQTPVSSETSLAGSMMQLTWSSSKHGEEFLPSTTDSSSFSRRPEVLSSLFVQSLDSESAGLQESSVPDPASSHWLAFDTKLSEPTFGSTPAWTDKADSLQPSSMEVSEYTVSISSGLNSDWTFTATPPLDRSSSMEVSEYTVSTSSGLNSDWTFTATPPLDRSSNMEVSEYTVSISSGLNFDWMFTATPLLDRSSSMEVSEYTASTSSGLNSDWTFTATPSLDRSSSMKVSEYTVSASSGLNSDWTFTATPSQDRSFVTDVTSLAEFYSDSFVEEVISSRPRHEQSMYLTTNMFAASYSASNLFTSEASVFDHKYSSVESQMVFTLASSISSLYSADTKSTLNNVLSAVQIVNTPVFADIVESQNFTHSEQFSVQATTETTTTITSTKTLSPISPTSVVELMPLYSVATEIIPQSLFGDVSSAFVQVESESSHQPVNSADSPVSPAADETDIEASVQTTAKETLTLSSGFVIFSSVAEPSQQSLDWHSALSVFAGHDRETSAFVLPSSSGSFGDQYFASSSTTEGFQDSLPVASSLILDSVPHHPYSELDHFDVITPTVPLTEEHSFSVYQSEDFLSVPHLPTTVASSQSGGSYSASGLQDGGLITPSRVVASASLVHEDESINVADFPTSLHSAAFAQSGSDVTPLRSLSTELFPSASMTLQTNPFASFEGSDLVLSLPTLYTEMHSAVSASFEVPSSLASVNFDNINISAMPFSKSTPNVDSSIVMSAHITPALSSLPRTNFPTLFTVLHASNAGESVISDSVSPQPDSQIISPQSVSQTFLTPGSFASMPASFLLSQTELKSSPTVESALLIPLYSTPVSSDYLFSDVASPPLSLGETSLPVLQESKSSSYSSFLGWEIGQSQPDLSVGNSSPAPASLLLLDSSVISVGFPTTTFSMEQTPALDDDRTLVTSQHVQIASESPSSDGLYVTSVAVASGTISSLYVGSGMESFFDGWPLVKTSLDGVTMSLLPTQPTRYLASESTPYLVEHSQSTASLLAYNWLSSDVSKVSDIVFTLRWSSVCSDTPLQESGTPSEVSSTLFDIPSSLSGTASSETVLPTDLFPTNSVWPLPTGQSQDTPALSDTMIALHVTASAGSLASSEASILMNETLMPSSYPFATSTLTDWGVLVTQLSRHVTNAASSPVPGWEQNTTWPVSTHQQEVIASSTAAAAAATSTAAVLSSAAVNVVTTPAAPTSFLRIKIRVEPGVDVKSPEFLQRMREALRRLYLSALAAQGKPGLATTSPGGDQPGKERRRRAADEEPYRPPAREDTRDRPRRDADNHVEAEVHQVDRTAETDHEVSLDFSLRQAGQQVPADTALTTLRGLNLTQMSIIVQYPVILLAKRVAVNETLTVGHPTNSDLVVVTSGNIIFAITRSSSSSAMTSSSYVIASSDVIESPIFTSVSWYFPTTSMALTSSMTPLTPSSLDIILPSTSSEFASPSWPTYATPSLLTTHFSEFSSAESTWLLSASLSSEVSQSVLPNETPMTSLTETSSSSFISQDTQSFETSSLSSSLSFLPSSSVDLFSVFSSVYSSGFDNSMAITTVVSSPYPSLAITTSLAETGSLTPTVPETLSSLVSSELFTYQLTSEEILQSSSVEIPIFDTQSAAVSSPSESSSHVPESLFVTSSSVIESSSIFPSATMAASLESSMESSRFMSPALPSSGDFTMFPSPSDFTMSSSSDSSVLPSTNDSAWLTSSRATTDLPSPVMPSVFPTSSTSYVTSSPRVPFEMTSSALLTPSFSATPPAPWPSTSLQSPFSTTPPPLASSSPIFASSVFPSSAASASPSHLASLSTTPPHQSSAVTLVSSVFPSPTVTSVGPSESSVVTPSSSSDIVTPSSMPVTPPPDILRAAMMKVDLEVDQGEDVQATEFKDKVETGLAKAYDIARRSRRKREAPFSDVIIYVSGAGQRHRRQAYPEVDARVTSVVRNSSDPRITNVTFYVTEDGAPVPASSASLTLHKLDDNELSAVLAYAVVAQPQPLEQALRPSPAQLEDGVGALFVVAVVLPCVLLLVLAALLLAFLSRSCRHAPHVPDTYDVVTTKYQRGESLDDYNLHVDVERGEIVDLTPGHTPTPGHTRLPPMLTPGDADTLLDSKRHMIDQWLQGGGSKRQPVRGSMDSGTSVAKSDTYLYTSGRSHTKRLPALRPVHLEVPQDLHAVSPSRKNAYLQALRIPETAVEDEEASSKKGGDSGQCRRESIALQERSFEEDVVNQRSRTAHAPTENVAQREAKSTEPPRAKPRSFVSKLRESVRRRKRSVTPADKYNTNSTVVSALGDSSHELTDRSMESQVSREGSTDREGSPLPPPPMFQSEPSPRHSSASHTDASDEFTMIVPLSSSFRHSMDRLTGSSSAELPTPAAAGTTESAGSDSSFTEAADSFKFRAAKPRTAAAGEASGSAASRAKPVPPARKLGPQSSSSSKESSSEDLTVKAEADDLSTLERTATRVGPVGLLLSEQRELSSDGFYPTWCSAMTQTSLTSSSDVSRDDERKGAEKDAGTKSVAVGPDGVNRKTQTPAHGKEKPHRSKRRPAKSDIKRSKPVKHPLLSSSSSSSDILSSGGSMETNSPTDGQFLPERLEPFHKMTQLSIFPFDQDNTIPVKYRQNIFDGEPPTPWPSDVSMPDGQLSFPRPGHHMRAHPRGPYSAMDPEERRQAEMMDTAVARQRLLLQQQQEVLRLDRRQQVERHAQSLVNRALVAGTTSTEPSLSRVQPQTDRQRLQELLNEACILAPPPYPARNLGAPGLAPLLPPSGLPGTVLTCQAPASFPLAAAAAALSPPGAPGGLVMLGKDELLQAVRSEMRRMQQE